MTDSIERKTSSLRAEMAERLRTQVALEAIVKAMPDALMVVDSDSKVSFTNPQACALFEREPEMMLGHNVPVDFARGKVIECPLVEERSVRRLEVRTVGMVWMGAEADLVMVRDRTELHELTIQLNQSNKMRALGQLSSGVAHDFNNLLAVITMCSELLAAGNLVDPEEGELLLNDIRGAAQRAKSVTSQLLVFSHRSSSRPELLNLSSVVADFLKIIGRLLGEQVRVEECLHPEVYPARADRVEMEQVLLNLALNGRDAMPTGGILRIVTENITIKEGIEREDARVPAGDYASLAVSDSGVGMDPAVLEHIFEPFYSTKETGDGTGMGLTNVFAIVERAGGVVSVRSVLGEGSTFRVYLPRCDDEAASAGLGATVMNGRLRGTEHVLVVEDENTVRKIIRLTLENYGYAVAEAGDGEEALRHLRSPGGRNINLVLSDVRLPVMSGQELSVCLKQERPDIRIIHMSGLPMAEAEVLVDAEPVPLLLKPFSPTTLLEQVRATLDREMS